MRLSIRPNSVHLLILTFVLLCGVSIALGPQPAYAQSTSTPTATLTALPPTATATATLTVAPPTATATATNIPPTNTPTVTAAPPTSTPTATPTPTSTPIPTVTPTSTTTPTPTVVPLSLLFRYYTVPEVVRATEPFELFVVLQNNSASVVRDIYLVPEAQASHGFIPFDSGSVRFPELRAGQRAAVSKGYRYLGANPSGIPDTGTAYDLNLHLTYQPGQRSSDDSVSLHILVLKPLGVVDPEPTLERTFAQPNLIVRRSWTTVAGSTDYSPLPVLLNEAFEIVLELHNIGQVEAENTYVDFPLDSDKFIPVGSTNRKYLTVSLGPDQHALVSQTLRPTTAGTPGVGGLNLDVTIGYDFRYAGQPVHTEATQTIGIYVTTPTPTPAPTQIPEPTEPRPVQVVVTATPAPMPTLTGPNVILRQSDSNPHPVVQGDAFEVWAELSNTGSAAATDLLITFQETTTLQFVGSSGVHYVRELMPGQTITVSQKLQPNGKNILEVGYPSQKINLQYKSAASHEEKTGAGDIPLVVVPPTSAAAPSPQSGAAPTGEPTANALSSGIGANQPIASSIEMAAQSPTLLSNRSGNQLVRIAAVGNAAIAGGRDLTAGVGQAAQPRWLRLLLAFLGLGTQRP
ncbi:MAG: hypothetical protein NT169_26740 [Chloroflexi bacterium]|nr:hypothetical protein [Chloroflexota bacterium]